VRLLLYSSVDSIHPNTCQQCTHILVALLTRVHRGLAVVVARADSLDACSGSTGRQAYQRAHHFIRVL
jgi:hypothetical protein